MISPSSNVMHDLTKRLKADSTLEAILERSYSDLGTFARVFTPEWVEQGAKTGDGHFEYMAPHRKILDFIDHLVNEQREKHAKGVRCAFKAAIRGVRGVAKTNFTMRILGARNIVFRESPFQIAITKSLKNTLFQTNALKTLLTRPGPLRLAIGRIDRPDQDQREAFGNELWIARIEDWLSAYLPMGREMTVQGLGFGKYRPQTFFLDDWEKAEELLNPDIRRKAWKYLTGEVMYAVSQIESANVPSQIWFTDSNKHPESCHSQVMKAKDNGWEKLDVDIMDEQFRSIDESFITTEAIQLEMAEARADGRIDQWLRERTTRAVSRENALFRREDFRYYDEGVEQLSKRSDLVTFLLSDPARTISPTAAFTGIVVVSVDLTKPAIYVRDVFNSRVTPSDKIINGLRLIKRWNVDVVGEEDAGLKDYSSEPWISALQLNNLLHVSFVPLSAHRGKEEFSSIEGAKVARAMPLSGYYRNHTVYHNRNCSDIAILEDQLESCPENSYWDLLDAFAHLLQAMTKMGLHFQTNGVGSTDSAPNWTDQMPDWASAVEAPSRWDKRSCSDAQKNAEDYALYNQSDWNRPLELNYDL